MRNFIDTLRLVIIDMKLKGHSRDTQKRSMKALIDSMIDDIYDLTVDDIYDLTVQEKSNVR